MELLCCFCSLRFGISGVGVLFCSFGCSVSVVGLYSSPPTVCWYAPSDLWVKNDVGALVFRDFRTTVSRLPRSLMISVLFGPFLRSVGHSIRLRTVFEVRIGGSFLVDLVLFFSWVKDSLLQILYLPFLISQPASIQVKHPVFNSDLSRSPWLEIG